MWRIRLRMKYSSFSNLKSQHKTCLTVECHCVFQEELLCGQLGQLHFQWSAHLDTAAPCEYNTARCACSCRKTTNMEDYSASEHDRKDQGSRKICQYIIGLKELID